MTERVWSVDYLKNGQVILTYTVTAPTALDAIGQAKKELKNILAAEDFDGVAVRQASTEELN